MAVIRDPNNDFIAQEGSIIGDGYTMGHGDHDVVTLIKLALAADEGFVLVDLTDTTNFPHSNTGKIRLYGLDVELQIESDGLYIVYIGVITEVDATDGSTMWLVAPLLQTVDNPTDSTRLQHERYYWKDGLDLEVSGGAPVNFLSNAGHSGDATWQTDTALDSPVGDASNAPGAGDLVMYVDETGGTGTISVVVTVTYITEAS